MLSFNQLLVRQEEDNTVATVLRKVSVSIFIENLFRKFLFLDSTIDKTVETQVRVQYDHDHRY